MKSDIAETLEEYAKDLDAMAVKCRIAASVVECLAEASSVRINYANALKKAEDYLKENTK